MQRKIELIKKMAEGAIFTLRKRGVRELGNAHLDKQIRYICVCVHVWVGICASASVHDFVSVIIIDAHSPCKVFIHD